MKKILAVLIALLAVSSLFSGCNLRVPDEVPDATGKKIAFISDMGDIKDHSYNQDSYLGVELFSQQCNAYCKYFKPSGTEQADLLAAIMEAIEEDFDVIVMAGSTFAKPCYQAAAANSGTLFLLLSATPEDMGVTMVPANVSLLNHKEEQAGFLAGYAAVADGYRELGFLGGVDVAPVVLYGYGFLQGIERAASDLQIDDVHVKYWYSGSFLPTQEITDKMIRWYQEGTEVIFSCGGGIYRSALEAADAEDGYLIGVDVDQSYLSPRFITSATKSLSKSVQLALNAAAENHMKWPDAYAGTCQNFGAATDCIGLPMENSHFKNFTPEIYHLLYEAMKRDSFTVNRESDPRVHPQTPHISVDWQS